MKRLFLLFAAAILASSVSCADDKPIDFDGKGNWKDVDCTPSGAVPAAIVPDQIARLAP